MSPKQEICLYKIALNNSCYYNYNEVNYGDQFSPARENQAPVVGKPIKIT